MVTVTSTVPIPPGEIAVIDVPEEFTTTFVAGVVPNSTVDSLVNPAPEIVTTVLPVAGPDVGEMPETTGT